MPKGNHVFNHFAKTIDTALKDLIEAAKIETATGGTIVIATAKASATSPEAIALKAKLPKAWPKFLEIVNAPQFEEWDEMQDVWDVDPENPNSKAYGPAAHSFCDEIKKIADQKTRKSAAPGKHWAKMVEKGYDETAALHYICKMDKGDNTKKAENAARKKQVEATKKWVSGALTGLVNTWISYLKLDMDGKS
jgi:hypothetical protein